MRWSTARADIPLVTTKGRPRPFLLVGTSTFILSHVVPWLISEGGGAGGQPLGQGWMSCWSSLPLQPPPPQ